MFAEALGAFFLMWAIIGVAVNPRATKEWAALAIGGALVAALLYFLIYVAPGKKAEGGLEPIG